MSGKKYNFYNIYLMEDDINIDYDRNHCLISHSE